MRSEERLTPIAELRGWVSPRMGVRFELEGKELVLYRPDGERFAPDVELRQRLEQQRQQAERERWRAEQAQREPERERQRAERLAQRLRELGINPEQLE